MAMRWRSTRVVERTDDEWIALAALAGAEITYYDYGHPERAGARMYWTAVCPQAPWGRVYSYTRAGCAREWLKYADLPPGPFPYRDGKNPTA